MAKRTTTRVKKTDAAKKLAVEAARIALDNKCEDVIVLDLKDRSPITDYFVIATGSSDRQMRSVADELTKYGKSIDQAPWHVAGLESSDWIVLDFVDVVVHLFDQAHRRYYDLELIWGEAPRVTWRRRAKKKVVVEEESAEE